MEEGVEDLSDKELEEKASDLCDVKVEIDTSETVGNNNLVKDSSILAVFIKKQSDAGAVAAPPHKTIATDPKEVGWVIIRVERSFMLLGNPSVRFFRRKET